MSSSPETKSRRHRLAVGAVVLAAAIVATGPGPTANAERPERNFFRLFDAIASGNQRVARRLLPPRDQIDDIDGSSGATPLTWVAITRYPDPEFGERITRLILDRGADVNAVDRSGDSPLHAAISYSRARIVTLLLERGANPNRHHPRYGRPPLVSLCERVGAEWPERAAARMTIARQMLRAGADPNGFWRRGDAVFTVGDECVHAGIHPIVRLVLRSGGRLERYRGREAEFVPPNPKR